MRTVTTSRNEDGYLKKVRSGNPAAGDVNRVDTQAEFLRYLIRRPASDHGFPARLPGRRGKVGLHQEQGATTQVALVLGFPEPLGEVGHLDVLSEMGEGFFQPDSPAFAIAEFVEQESPQPGAEFATPVVLELWGVPK